MTKVLIIKPSSLGDIIHGLQVATSLKAQRPELEISWIVREVFAPLVRASRAVDHVHVFSRSGGLRGFMGLMGEVRRTRFDAALDMQGLLRTGLMMARVRADRKVGRSDAREMAWLFCTEAVALPPAGRSSHALDILLQFCPVLGAAPELRGNLTFRQDGPVPDWPGAGGPDNRPYILFPDSRRAEKQWGGFRDLTAMLLREDCSRPVIWAGSQPMQESGSFPAGRFLNLTGATGLDCLPALLGRAAWVVANDSGPMHLAAAMGVPVVGIFGPTDPRLYGPYPPGGPNNHVIQAPLGDLRRLGAREVFESFARIRARVGGGK